MSQKAKYQLLQNVEIACMHSAGKAIGLHKKRRIYIDNAIPGEVADVLVAKRQKGYVKGSVDKITQPSNQRVEPFCKHFLACGGCNWQHISYSHQLELKQTILQNALDKYAIVTPPVPLPIASPYLQYYRNKTEYAFSADTNDSFAVFGFHQANCSDCVMNIDECYLQPEPSRKIYEAAKNIAQQQSYTYYNYANNSGMLRSLSIRTTTVGETAVIIGFAHCTDECKSLFIDLLLKAVPEITSVYYTVLSKADLRYADIPHIHVNGTATHLTERMGNLTFKISPKAFYQPNPLQAENIYKQVLQYGDFKGTERVVDLYTGIGTIACYVASAVGDVTGVEGSADAIADAKVNASLNGITNATFITGDILETFTPCFLARHGKIDVLVLDPPRSGTLIEIKKTILAAAPSKIIYVSCNPVSLAFDLKQLCAANYQVAAIQPFDMFPHTHHIETVVLLQLV